tara:strand:+ start:897 stop:1145 length:249 start_codon:yes stop_codon:yes gene_type:complete
MSDPTFVVRGDLGTMRWVIRLSHEGMGESPVGPRLAKGTPFPKEIGTHFEKKCDALRACEKWTDWYLGQPYLKKKRKAKYIA